MASATPPRGSAVASALCAAPRIGRARTGVSGEALAKKRRAVAEGVRCNRWGDAFSSARLCRGPRARRHHRRHHRRTPRAHAGLLEASPARRPPPSSMRSIRAPSTFQVGISRPSRRIAVVRENRQAASARSRHAARRRLRRNARRCLVRAAAACHTGMATSARRRRQSQPLTNWESRPYVAIQKFAFTVAGSERISDLSHTRYI